MKKTIGLFCSVVSLLAASAWSATGVALLKGTADRSTITGRIDFADTPQGLKISASIQGAPAGAHGFHIHEFGLCDDVGKAAGGHFNPHAAPHGSILKDGTKKAHLGDLGNLTIQADGSGTLEALIAGVTLSNSPFTVGGRAVILHEKVDDFGQPVGNAGGRIGCGPIVITAQ